jgi:hypothetical protein
MTYSYYINLDERGEFYADVRDDQEATVLELHGFDIFEDGYMKHSADLDGLASYMADLGIMKQDDSLVDG